MSDMRASIWIWVERVRELYVTSLKIDKHRTEGDPEVYPELFVEINLLFVSESNEVKDRAHSHRSNTQLFRSQRKFRNREYYLL